MMVVNRLLTSLLSSVQGGWQCCVPTVSHRVLMLSSWRNKFICSLTPVPVPVVPVPVVPVPIVPEEEEDCE